jgi:HAE1 family hydrophobic/amphiphilic exporter-1
MIGDISAPIARYPLTILLLMAAVLAFGVIANPSLPIAPSPNLEFPTIRVFARLPGASAETMATSVALPLERAFAKIAGVRTTTSSSKSGTTTVTVEFDPGRPIEFAANAVQAAMNAVSHELPLALPSPPALRKMNSADTPIVLFSITSDTLSLPEVNELAEIKIKQRLNQLSGVNRVTTSGEQKPAVRIQLDPEKLAASGLSLEDVRFELEATARTAARGEIDAVLGQYSIYANDQHAQAEYWNNAVVVRRGTQSVRVGDIGRVVVGPENAKAVALVQGRPGVILGVYKNLDANAISVVESIKAELPRISSELPPNVNAAIINDRTQTIRTSLGQLTVSLLLGIGGAVGITALVLRSLRLSLVPLLVVASTLIGAMGVFHLTGYGLDNISILALMICVGFLLDDAVIATESIGYRAAQGLSITASEIGTPLVFASACMVGILTPLLFVGGAVGLLMREFATTTIICVVTSVVFALALTPLIASHLLKSGRADQRRPVDRAPSPTPSRTARVYEGALRFILARRMTAVIFIVAMLILTPLLFLIVPKGFLPRQDTGQLLGILEAPEGTTFERLKEQHAEIGRVLLSDPVIESYFSLIEVEPQSGATSQNQFYITLKPKDERALSADHVMARLRAMMRRLNDLRFFVISLQDFSWNNLRGASSHRYTLQFSNVDDLKALAPKLVSKIADGLGKIPGIIVVSSGQKFSGLSWAVEHEHAAKHGVSSQMIDETIFDAFGQRRVGQFFTSQNSHGVIMEIGSAVGDRNMDSQAIRLRSRSVLTDGWVALSELVKWKQQQSSLLEITHLDRLPSVAVNFNLSPGAQLGAVAYAIKLMEASLQLPSSVIGKLDGLGSIDEAQRSSIPLLMIIAVGSVYVLLAFCLGSFIHPLTILSVLPLACAGAIGTQYVFDLEFGLISMGAAVAVVGIALKYVTLTVHSAISAQRDGALTALEAICGASARRLPAITMATIAVVLAGTPLVAASGLGAELWHPLGYGIIGGMVVNLLLLPLLVPVIFVTLDRLRRLGS